MNKGTVSVIITTRNAARHIGPCLDSLKKQTYPGEKIEILVVDNNSTDATAEIAKKYTAKVYNQGPERSAQRNFGIRQASGEYILYLDADMTLSECVIAECMEKCGGEANTALYIPERIIGPGFWTRVRDFERGFYNATVVDCVRFFRKESIERIGGFDEGLTGPEDWDLDRRIGAVCKTGIINAVLYHNESDFNLMRYLCKKAYYAGSFANYIRKWGKSDPIIKKQLGFGYRFCGVFLEGGKWRKLLVHPLLTLNMYFLRVMAGLSLLFRQCLCAESSYRKGILILSPFFRPNIGGVENYLYDLCEYLRTHGYAVYVVTYQPLTVNARGKPFELKENMQVRRVSWFGHNLFHRLEPYPILEFIYLTPCLFMFTFFFMLKNRGRIDVLHAQGLNAAFIVRILAGVFRKRAVMSTCAVYNFHKGSAFSALVRWALSGMDKILPLADFSRRELEDIGLSGAKMNTYYLWVDQDRYLPAEKGLSKRAVNLEGEFMVLFVGRFIRIKGVQALVEAARMSDPRINFVFIGDQGPLLGHLENEAGIRRNIRLIKGISGEQLIPYYQAADVFVIPSQYDEAFGKVIIESLSCGTPVIGANRGAIPDIISPLVGRVIDPTPDNLKESIEYFYRHPDALDALARNCRAYAQRRFSEKNIEVITRSYYP